MNTVIALRPSGVAQRQVPVNISRHAQPRFGVLGGPLRESSVESRLKTINDEIVKADNHATAVKNRQAYQKLQRWTFDYGGQPITALELLEIIHKRESYRQTLGNSFHQLKNLSDDQQKAFVKTLDYLYQESAVTFDYHSESPNDYVPQGRGVRYSLTSYGTTLINQYQSDLAKANEAKAKPSGRPEALEKADGTAKGSEPFLKTLLTPTEYGATPLFVLKELNSQMKARNRFLAFFIGTGVSEKKLLAQFPGATSSQILASVVSLINLGLVTSKLPFLSNMVFNLTPKGEKLLAEDNLWATGLVSPDDVKAWIDGRIQGCRDATAQLKRIMGEFESAYQKADEDYQQTHRQVFGLSVEARTAFQQSKDTSLTQEQRDAHIKTALAKKEEAKALQVVLETEKRLILQEATYQLNLALNREEKVSADIAAQYQQAQADQVSFKMATLQKGLADLGKLLAKLTKEGATVEDPVQGLRKSLQQQWDAEGAESDADMLRIQQRIKERLKKSREETLKDELEAELQEVKPLESQAEAPMVEAPAAEQMAPKTMSSGGKPD